MKHADSLHFTITDANEYPEILATMGLKADQMTGFGFGKSQYR